MFNCVKPSLVPTKPAPCRPTSRTSSSIQSVIPDEMEKFIAADKIDNFQHLNSKLNNKLIEFGEIEVIWYSLSSSLVIQSSNFIENSSITRYMLRRIDRD